MNARVLTTALIAAGITTATGALAAPALADTAPSTKTVAWVVTSGDFGARFAKPQRLLTAADTCGVLEQIDVYRYGTPDDITFVDALVARGTLDSAAEDGPVYVSSEDVTLPACATSTPTPPATVAPTPPVTAPASPTSSPTPTATPSVPTTTPSPTSQPSAPATAAATKTASPVSSVGGPTRPELAFTGTRSRLITFGLLTGTLLAGAGVSLKIYEARSRRRKARP